MSSYAQSIFIYASEAEMRKSLKERNHEEMQC